MTIDECVAEAEQLRDGLRAERLIYESLETIRSVT